MLESDHKTYGLSFAQLLQCHQEFESALLNVFYDAAI